MNRSRLFRGIALLGATVAGLGMLAAISAVPLQRRLMFPGTNRTGDARALDAAHGRQVWLTTRQGPVEAWHLPAVGNVESKAPLVIYAHGNGELIDDWATRFDSARADGLGVLLVEYPGYGRSAGAPSEASIRDTLRAAYDWAAAYPEIDATRIVGHGRSLGGGAIAALSQDRSLCAVVLESTFTSTAAVASEHGLPSWLIRDRFDSEAALRDFSGPTLVLHGRRDALIPLRLALRLRAAAKRPSLQIEECGHNGCPDPWALVRAFLRVNHLLPESNSP